MSAMANTTPIVTTVTKAANKEKTPKEADAALKVNILDFCEEQYEDILPVIMDKIRRDKRKKSMLGWTSKKLSRKEVSQGHQRQSAFDRLSDTYSPSTTMSGPNMANSRYRSRSRGRPADETLLLAEIVLETETTSVTSKNHMEGKANPCYLACRRAAPVIEDTRSQNQKDASLQVKKTWQCPGHVNRWIHSRLESVILKVRGKTRMPNNVKTYDRTGDLKDHVKFFQAAAQVERWALPKWCHMFSSTIIGTARVWFDDLPSESIDGYKDLKAAILAYFMQQKQYIKDPVEIHNIKQRDEETIEDFIERFKVETGPMKGAPECMRIFGFMHGVNNPELKKRLNEHVPKTMEEMTTVTTAFIRGETPATSKKEGHTLWKPQDQPKRHVSERRYDFRGKLSHLIKEIKQGRDQPKLGMKEVSAKRNYVSTTGYQRPRIREIQSVPSTAHGMLKFSVDGGIVTICSTILMPIECAAMTTASKEILKEAEVRHENFKVALHLNFLDPLSGGYLAEHQLNIQEGYTPLRQKKKGQASEHARVIQVEMAESDEEKMAFHTSHGVYCYTKMPFGLKNTGATYQRLVDKSFDSQVEVQSLNGKLASLNRFVSKSAKKSLPLFKTLKKCIKKSDFHWTLEAKQAFKQLKQHLSKQPMLVASKPKEELIVYLVASCEAISAVLMIERDMVQTPVYFVSHTLQGPELNYTSIEKLVLTLVFVAKRLRRYFQAHPIAVITDQPIKQIMSLLDVAGRLEKWSAMLGEHNITYRPRTSVKGQIITPRDFRSCYDSEFPLFNFSF
nr:reverse transcriptase domain-containing protein [Tanacetum cinerariifolium]GEW22653.1 reverse transcriptase domain-containing protein [Tanacetum cinerariifolium]GEW22662.1 reverse transcriptase domain-containing protein [Tanacetum cinerariifolium]